MSIAAILHRMQPKRPGEDAGTRLSPGEQIERKLARTRVLTGPPTVPWDAGFGSGQPPAPGTWRTDPETLRLTLNALRTPGATHPRPEKPAPALRPDPVPFAEDVKGLRIFPAVLRQAGWCGLHVRRQAPAPLPLRHNPSLDRWHDRAMLADDAAVRAARAEIRARAEIFDAREKFLRQRHVTGSAA